MRPLVAFVFTAFLSGCATFDAPPEVTLQGLAGGLLHDPHAPIVLVFSKPPEPATVKIEIAKYIVDSDGRLGDEPGNTLGMPLQTLFSHDPVSGDTGGVGVLAPDGSTMTITPAVVPPVGGQLVVLVEPGLADLAGTVTRVRRRAVFGYASTLDCNAPAHVAVSGTYFFVVAVTKPFGAQLELFTAIDVDSATGSFKAQLTRARRNADPSRCSPPCSSSDVCATVLDPPACITPSTPATSVDDFPDYVPNATPPAGFSFAAPGCVADQGAMSTSLVTGPIDVSVASPMVTLRNASLSASLALGDGGTLRGTGTLTADAVLLGTDDSSAGQGQGNLTVRSIAAGAAPPGVPEP